MGKTPLFKILTDTSLKPLLGLSTASGTNSFEPKLLIPPSNFKAEKCAQHGGRRCQIVGNFFLVIRQLLMD
jgi:hypothetical protein